MIDLRLGDCIEVMKGMDANSVDAIVTDPPYGLEFMGKEWDKLKRFDHRDKSEKSASMNRDNAPIGTSPTYIGGAPAQDWHYSWAVEALRVAKPGAHLIAAGAPRTHHRLMCALEDAGWEIRDVIMHVFGSGFPKSMNIGKAIRKSYCADDLCSCVRHSIGTAQDSQSDYPLDYHSYDEQPLLDQDNDQDTLPLSIDVLGHIHDDQHEDDQVSIQANISLDEAIDHQPNADSSHPLAHLQEDCQLNDSRQYDNQENKSLDDLMENHKKVYDKSDILHSEDDSVSFSLDNPPELMHSNISHCPKCGKPIPEYYDGFGTSLKPAYEPWIICRKPVNCTVAENVLKWGTGAMNIDASRIPINGEKINVGSQHGGGEYEGWGFKMGLPRQEGQGRWPANLIHDGSDEVLAGFPETKTGDLKPHQQNSVSDSFGMKGKYITGSNHGDSGSAARFFKECSFTQEELCEFVNIVVESSNQQRNQDDSALSIAPISEAQEECANTMGSQVIRDCTGNFNGCSLIQNLVSIAENQENTDIIQIIKSLLKSYGYVQPVIEENIKQGRNGGKGNTFSGQNRFVYCAKASKRDRDEGLEYRNNGHPTVKPTALMQYLCRLVTPPGGVILDPFMGSGSTGKAAVLEGFSFIGIELDPEYFEIAEKRIAKAQEQPKLEI